MPLKLNTYLARLLVLTAYPIVYYTWVKNIQNTWVSPNLFRFKTILFTPIKMFFTHKEAATMPKTALLA